MKKARYLFPSDYMADPSVHVFNDKLYIYPSHDWDSGAAFDDDGGHFEMKDYHVLTLTDIENEEAIDCGKILDLQDIPWAGRQMWDNDVVEKDGKYYLIFSARIRTTCSISELPLPTDLKDLLSRSLTIFAVLTR